MMRNTTSDDFLHGELTYYLRGAGFRIHNELKGGHVERVYEDALCWVMERDGVPFLRQHRYDIHYRGQYIGHFFPDLMLADEKVVLDLKATRQIEPAHVVQVLSYMKLTDAELGVLLNFGASSVESKRLPNFLHKREPLDWKPSVQEDILYPELTNTIMQALYEVHHRLGLGFVSKVYGRATRIELSRHGLSTKWLYELPLRFEGLSISTVPIRVFWIEGKILLAAFSLSAITAHHTEKMRWAMQELGCQLGMIANYHSSRLDVRFIR